jgi:hypothetical protein
MMALRGSIKTVLGMVGLLALAVGCASVPTTDSAADAAAKKFQPEPGKASIYLCRHGAGMGDTRVAETQLDGKTIGGLAPNTFLMVSVAPGHHTLGVAGPTNTEQLPVDAVAGNLYFFDVSIQWAGPMIRHRHIEAMSDADGRNAVNGQTRAATTSNPD